MGSLLALAPATYLFCGSPFREPENSEASGRVVRLRSAGRRVERPNVHALRFIDSLTPADVVETAGSREDRAAVFRSGGRYEEEVLARPQMQTSAPALIGVPERVAVIRECEVRDDLVVVGEAVSRGAHLDDEGKRTRA